MKQTRLISNEIIHKAKEKQKNYIKEREKELEKLQLLKYELKDLYRENIVLRSEIMEYINKERAEIFKKGLEVKQEKEKLIKLIDVVENENQELRDTLREYEKKNIKRLKHNENNRKWRKNHKEYIQQYNQMYWINKVLKEKGELINVE